MKAQVELRHLRYFRAVAETLHFGKAAVQLGMAQPPLSQQIKTLEGMVGYRLFDRTTRGVQLTTVGQYLLLRAQKTLDRIDQDLDMARRIGLGQEGVLSVGFSGSIMMTRLPFVLEHYRRLYPKVELQLQEFVTAEQMAALKEGILNVGFLRDGEADGEIHLRTLLREKFVAILPYQHPLASRTSLRPADLRAEPFVF
jgi:DNA-binding transcriptional LysR family regulator